MAGPPRGANEPSRLLAQLIGSRVVPKAKPPHDPLPPKPDELPQLEVIDEAQYVIDRRTGWPAELTHERRTVTGNQGRLDTLRFEVEIAAPAEAESK